jgi:hypothetical protein
LADARRNFVTEQDIDRFLQKMKALTTLYGSALDDERRRLLENVFSQRTISETQVGLEVSDWVAMGIRGCKFPSSDQIAAANNRLPSTLQGNPPVGAA